MKLEGKIINFLGDSLTEGIGTTCEENRFSNILEKELKLKCMRNYGVSGTRIAKNKSSSKYTIWDYDFNSRAKLMDKNADLVIVFGGTNDFGHGDAEIGSLNSYNQYTFCGAVNSLIKYLKKVYGQKKIVFLPPIHRFDENDKENRYKKLKYPLSHYVDVLKKLCEKKHIYCLDWFNNANEFMREVFEKCLVDGVHVNDEGHQILATEIKNYLSSLED